MSEALIDWQKRAQKALWIGANPYFLEGVSSGKALYDLANIDDRCQPNMSGFFSKGGRLSGHLGRRLVVMILLTNSVFSLFAVGFQLYASYNSGRLALSSTVQAIESKFKHGFEEALWKYDLRLVEALLDGVMHSDGVRHIVLEAGDGLRWERGPSEDQDESFGGEIYFTHVDVRGQEASLGRMFVGLSMASVKARVWSQFWTLLLSNFAKMVCVSIIILVLFDQMVTRHLDTIARHVSESGWFGRHQRLVLDRTKVGASDDLDRIVTALNQVQKKGRDDLYALKSEIQRRHDLELQLRARSQALQSANEEQSQFTYAISHDMKSPANTIHMLLDELTHTDHDALSADGKLILQDAQSTVRRMIYLIEDVLQYARTVGDGMTVTMMDMNALLQDTVNDLKGDLAGQGAQVEIGIIADVPGNAAQLRLLFQNLISNGVKFSKDGVPARVVVSQEPAVTPDHIRIRVSDNGIGIAPEYHSKVFALFQRLHTHAQYPGSGLGLTVCKRVVANHGGQIHVVSSLGGGCAFDVELPLGEV